MVIEIVWYRTSQELCTLFAFCCALFKFNSNSNSLLYQQPPTWEVGIFGQGALLGFGTWKIWVNKAHENEKGLKQDIAQKVCVYWCTVCESSKRLKWENEKHWVRNRSENEQEMGGRDVWGECLSQCLSNWWFVHFSHHKRKQLTICNVACKYLSIGIKILMQIFFCLFTKIHQ